CVPSIGSIIQTKREPSAWLADAPLSSARKLCVGKRERTVESAASSAAWSYWVTMSVPPFERMSSTVRKPCRATVPAALAACSATFSSSLSDGFSGVKAFSMWPEALTERLASHRVRPFPQALAAWLDCLCLVEADWKEGRWCMVGYP